MGKGLVDELKKEFGIKDEWVNFELHPETPGRGVRLVDRFSGFDIHYMYEHLRKLGEPLGIRFGEVETLPNSRLSLEAAEYARDNGRFEEYHHALFYAYFTEAKDVGDRRVLLDLADEVGLSREGLEEALEDGRYLPRLEETAKRARQSGVTAIPTFVFPDGEKVTGIKPLEELREVIRRHSES